MRLLSQNRGGLEAAERQEREKHAEQDPLPPAQAGLLTGGWIEGSCRIAAAGVYDQENGEHGKDDDFNQAQEDTHIRRNLDAEEGQGEGDCGEDDCVKDPPVRPEREVKGAVQKRVGHRPQHEQGEGKK